VAAAESEPIEEEEKEKKKKRAQPSTDSVGRPLNDTANYMDIMRRYNLQGSVTSKSQLKATMALNGICVLSPLWS
jgi:hypothetical protein